MKGGRRGPPPPLMPQARSIALECHGCFDIIGDVHGCHDLLVRLLEELGYHEGVHEQGRCLVFVGDLVDRGPEVLATLRLVRSFVESGRALAVMGNHDDKLRRWLMGRRVQVTHGLDRSIAELSGLTAEERQGLAEFLGGLPTQLVLDEGRLVVAHAGLYEELQGVDSGAARRMALYGVPTGEKTVEGLPVRRDWAADYRGRALVVYGHTPVPEPRWLNNTVNIDLGAVYGGALAALRYPERTVVRVAANSSGSADSGSSRCNR